jgi:sentrin-specific protease 7
VPTPDICHHHIFLYWVKLYFFADSNLARMAEEAPVDNVVIVVEDSESPSSPKRMTGALQDTYALCDFPPGVSPNITVTLKDYKTLEHDIYLNDIIVDFYLGWLFTNILPADRKETVHIFTSMFYKRMMRAPSKTDQFERDANISQAEKRHLRVKGWTKNVDLFSKELIVIPICENSHWYLVLIIRPGLIIHPVDSEERRTRGDPFIIVLDSLGDNKTTAVNILRNYLNLEWQVKVGT